MKSEPHDRQIDRGIRFLTRSDKKLAAVIKQVGKLNYRSRRSGFEALARTIIGQQLSGKVAETIFQRVRGLTTQRRVSLKALRLVDDNALRGAGLSAAKTRAIRDLIEKVETGQLKIRSLPHMSDDEVTAAITQVKGLGPWSAQMYLMFVLCRLDVFAAGDLGIQNAIRRLYRLDGKAPDFEKYAERWRPYRTVACWYLWASLGNAPVSKD